MCSRFFDLSLRDSVCLKGFACLGVVLCHVFPSVNSYGFLFVSLFFFLSGNGFRLRGSPITFQYAFKKIVPIGVAFFVVSLPSLFFGGFSWIPPSWFMVPYSMIVFGLCFLPSPFVFALVGSFCLFMSVDCFAWGISWFFFFFGFWFGRIRFFSRFLLFLGFFAMVLFVQPVILPCSLLTFCFLFIVIACKRLFKPFFSLGRVSLPVYVLHCLPLGLFGLNHWLNGGIFLYLN